MWCIPCLPNRHLQSHLSGSRDAPSESLATRENIKVRWWKLRKQRSIVLKWLMPIEYFLLEQRGIILSLIIIQAGIQQWSDELYKSTVNHIDFSLKRVSQTNILTSNKLFADFQIYCQLIILTWDSSSDATSQRRTGQLSKKEQGQTSQHAVLYEMSTRY